VNIVVDTSAIIAVIANEPEKDILIELTRGADLIAPHSIHWEVGNAFSAMLKRKRITLAQALKSAEIYKTISIRFLDVGLEQALKLADELDIYAYDAYIIECALKYKSPLISLDRNLANIAKRMKVNVLEVM
jgi:predicted nucleic acid-binding protein